MTNLSFQNSKSSFKLFLVSFLLAVLTYGFALTNFTISIDNETPILPDYGLNMGRWGSNFILYYVFGGHLQYFSLILSLFLFTIAAVRLAKAFQFKGASAYFFCGLFLTFPQLAYQLVFGMMAVIAALGVLLSVLCVDLFLMGFETKSSGKKIFLFSSSSLILAFTLSMYQAFILVPATIYLILFLQNTYKEEFKSNLEIKKMLVFGGIVLVSGGLYFVSAKLICPPIEDGYLSSYVSGNSDNQFLNFCSIWFKNLIGGFYYGAKTFIVVAVLSLFLVVRFFMDKKFAVIRVLSLLIILALPFLMSYFITNGYHPPRLYLTSNLVFAFVIVFTLNHFRNTSFNAILLSIALLVILNFYFITRLFYTVNKIYKYDKKIAEKIDYTIQTKYPSFLTTEKVIYFYGYLPYEYHQKFRLQDCEVFGGSIFNWDNGNNYRMVNFFREADVAEYKMIDTKEAFNSVKDSIEKMPVWPDSESVKMFNNIVVVKLGKDKGCPLYFE